MARSEPLLTNNKNNHLYIHCQLATILLVFFELERNPFRILISCNKENDVLLFPILANQGRGWGVGGGEGWCYSSHKQSLLQLHWQSSQIHDPPPNIGYIPNSPEQTIANCANNQNQRLPISFL